MTLQEDLNLIKFRDKVVSELHNDTVENFRFQMIQKIKDIENFQEDSKELSSSVRARESVARSKRRSPEYWQEMLVATEKTGSFKEDDNYIVPARQVDRPGPPVAASLVYDY